jgi:lysophospholipase L1-like esterase
VVINLGTNDVVQGWPIDQSAAGLEQIVSLFPDANCIHLTTVSEFMPDRTSTTEADAIALNDAIRTMAATNPQIRIVDWNEIVAEQQAAGVDLTSDGVHPTDEGQQLLVDAYEESMLACPDD